MSEPSIDLYVVIWNGEMLELEALDAITCSRADAEAVVAASPGRRESYAIERTGLADLLASAHYAATAERMRERLRTLDFSPMMVRDDAERQRRAS